MLGEEGRGKGEEGDVRCRIGQIGGYGVSERLRRVVRARGAESGVLRVGGSPSRRSAWRRPCRGRRRAFLFIDAFIEDLRLSRSAVSWLYTGATVLGSLGLPLAGRLLDRYGPRRVAVVLIALLAASCAGMRWVSGWDWARPGPRRSSRPSWKGAARPTAGRRRV
ncbi:MFS transporter [Salinibacter ruber]|uniref:MFS transporter n=1 Tax=Salinibacter ruber TaxID=146919 RepID=UPI003C6E0319